LASSVSSVIHVRHNQERKFITPQASASRRAPPRPRRCLEPVADIDIRIEKVTRILRSFHRRRRL
jgi:hypothetical protein